MCWTNHSDTFDENTPPTDDPEYISSLGAAIFKGIQSGDDDAVWLMQVIEIGFLLLLLFNLDLILLSVLAFVYKHRFSGKLIYSPIKLLIDPISFMQGWLFSYDPFWRPPQMKVIFKIFDLPNCSFSLQALK